MCSEAEEFCGGALSVAPEGPDPTPRGLGEHLDELRVRLIRSLLALGAGTAAGLALIQPLIRALEWPLERAMPEGVSRIALRTLAPGEALSIILRGGITAGFVLASPIILREIWLFLAPGLTGKEKRGLLQGFIAGAFLFLLGAGFCYGLILPMALKVFLGANAALGLEPAWTLATYTSFCLTLMLAFGAVFELPVVMVLLTKMGIVSRETMAGWRAYVIVGIFVVAGIVTPTTDLVSQVAMALPLWGLYELTLIYLKRT